MRPERSRTCSARDSTSVHAGTLQRAQLVPVRPRHPVVLYFCQMSHTLTIRLTADLAEWLREASQQSGVPQGRIIREQLEKARERDGRKRYMRLAGTVRGSGDLSRRKGFTR